MGNLGGQGGSLDASELTGVRRPHLFPSQGGGVLLVLGRASHTHPRSHFVFVCDIYGDHLHLPQRLLVQLMNLEQEGERPTQHRNLRLDFGIQTFDSLTFSNVPKSGLCHVLISIMKSSFMYSFWREKHTERSEICGLEALKSLIWAKLRKQVLLLSWLTAWMEDSERCA